MQKLVPIIVLAILITLTAIGGFVVYVNTINHPKGPNSPAVIVPSDLPRKTDPAGRSAYDADLAKKFVLYHELATQLDNYAVEHTSRAEVRDFATQQSTYNTAQVEAYVALLSSWGETFFRLDDFPKVAGSSCGSYPTFPGMLPHAEVNAYLQSNPDDVDEQYLRLTAQHHSDITTTISANEAFADNGKFTALRENFMITRDNELEQIRHMQAGFRRR